METRDGLHQLLSINDKVIFHVRYGQRLEIGKIIEMSSDKFTPLTVKYMNSEREMKKAIVDPENCVKINEQIQVAKLNNPEFFI